ncbi:MAG: hypothetical protein LBC84_07750 [Prevotellaceae bacterium]|jgi:futalosine hydrolase|nr:hypothetical protein [Prevotellaceae bacterium]
MRILITAATSTELLPALELKETLCNKLTIDAIETGIGTTPTAYHTLKAIAKSLDPRYDLAINIGIAGTLCNSLSIGSVVRVTSDHFGDNGIQTALGFQNLFDAQLLDANVFPYKSKRLSPDNLTPQWESALASLPIAQGITVQHPSDRPTMEVNGIETMEGAAFFYVCIYESIPCFALRAISNRAGERDKSKWNIPLAINSLQKTLSSFLHAL